MKKVNNKYIAEQSESATSYLTCLSNKDQHDSMGQYNKVQTTSRKSRLYIKDLFCESDNEIIHKSNSGRLKSNIDSKTSSLCVSTKTLCVVSQKRKKFQKPMMATYSENLAPTKYSSRTSCNKTSTKRYYSSASLKMPYKKKDQFTVRSFTQYTTVLESTHRHTGRPLQGLSNTESITSKYFNDFKKGYSNLTEDIKSHSGHTFKDISRQSNDYQSDATSLKLKSIINDDIYSESEEETQFSRKRRTHDFPYKLNADEGHPYDKLTNVQTKTVDFESMNRCLQNSSSPIKKFEILQCLLLRLTRQESLERLETVQAIIDNDLFSIKRKSGCEIIIKNLLWPLNVRTPHPIQTSAAKLINALVSYQIGREYFNHMSMINLLTWSETELMSESMKDNLMAVMMKLSLSQFHRCDMLQKGLIQWLINHMEKVEFTASKFHLECMTDLLRVLMDVDNATEVSFVKIPQLIIVLVRYMNVENEYVKINVCHALRALFRNSTAIGIANKIHLHRIIQYHIQRTSNSKLKEDLKFIYKLFVNYRMHESSKQGASSARNRVCNHDREIRSSCSERNIMTMKCYSDPEMHIKKDEESLKLKTKFMVTASENHYLDRSESPQCSEKFKQDLLSDISSCILQMCMKKKMEDGKPFRKKSIVDHSESEDYTTDESFESASSESECSTPRITSSATNKGNQQTVNDDDKCSTPDVIYTNLNWKINHNSSLLNSEALISTRQAKTDVKEKGINKSSVAVDMEDTNKNESTISASQLEKSKPNNMKSPTKSIDYSDLNSIAKDPVARKEILENESFIEELCEKVVNKLRLNFFCGPKCNTNKCCEKKPDDAS